MKRNKYYYYCPTCDLEFHRGCHLLPPKVSHPFHLHHSLTLTSSDPSFLSSNNLLIGILYPPVHKSLISISDGNHVKCKYCQRHVKDRYYHCSVCNFSLDINCALNSPPLTIENQKIHDRYDRLETEKKKSCFLYCSLFQEDYEIKKEELIEYWISEEFIKGERDEDGSNNEGYDIIGSLVRAHLLMECDTKSSFFQIGFTPAVKMHDVLREMALWIGKEEEKQCVNSGGKLSCIPDDINWSVLRRISLMSNKIEEISCCPKCPNLSTLFLGDNDLKVNSFSLCRPLSS